MHWLVTLAQLIGMLAIVASPVLLLRVAAIFHARSQRLQLAQARRDIARVNARFATLPALKAA